MKSPSRLLLARSILSVALLIALFGAARCGMVAYASYRIGGIHMHQPAGAEEVSRSAAPFQDGTPRVNGMYNIVKSQHADLTILYERLTAEVQTGWGLAVGGAALGSVIAILLTICLLILPSNRN